MSEVFLVSGTKIVQAIFAIRRLGESLLRAAAVASKFEFARSTEFGKRVSLIGTKLPLFGAFGHHANRFFFNVAEVEFGIYVVVARVHVTIVLNDHCVATGFGEDAQPGILAHPTGKSCIEDLNEVLTYVFSHPLIEDAVQEVAVLL